MNNSEYDPKLRRARKARKRARRIHCVNKLRRYNVPFQPLEKYRLLILPGDVKFWPQTGKWRHEDIGVEGKGLTEVMEYIGVF